MREYILIKSLGQRIFIVYFWLTNIYVKAFVVAGQISQISLLCILKISFNFFYCLLLLNAYLSQWNTRCPQFNNYVNFNVISILLKYFTKIRIDSALSLYIYLRFLLLYSFCTFIFFMLIFIYCICWVHLITGWLLTISLGITI